MSAVVESYPVPVPIDLPRPDGSRLRRRAFRTLAVVGRRFGPTIGRKVLRRPDRPGARARALRLTFEDLGATYVKFGQLIGSAPGVFGEAVSNEFRSCLDTGPAVSFERVRAIVEADLDCSIEDAFATFGAAPVAAASIAVVHKATLRDGRVVAVKVLRPEIEDIVAADLDLMQPLFELLARQVGVGLAGPLLQLLAGFREQVAEEMDLRNEARAMSHYRGLLREVDLPKLAVPEPFDELSGRRTLTMDFLDGVPIDDLARAAELGVDPRPLVEQAVKGWFLTGIRNGTFHGDVHAGNLLLTRDGRLGVLDWGIVGRLDHETHVFFRRLIEAALGDHTAWDDIAGHFRRVYGPAMQEAVGLSDAEMVDFFRRQMEPILTRPFGEVSLSQIFQGPQDRAGQAEGEIASRRSPREVVRRWREMRRYRNRMAHHGGVGSSFDRGTFLLGKQLLYFERYGKMFLSDVSLVADEEFLRAALAGPPISA